MDEPKRIRVNEKFLKLQVGSGGQTRIILGGAENRGSYTAAPKGDVFVEFKIPAKTHIGTVGKKNVHGMIYSKDSLFSKLLKKRGVKLEMPTVSDIQVID